MKKVSIFFILFILFSKSLFAIPGYPHPITFTQPNGETLTVLIKGDERIHWHETTDGYTLLFNKAGYLSYAQLDENGHLQPSEMIATNVEQRDTATNSFLQTINKKMFFSEEQKQIMLQVWKIEDDAQKRNTEGVIGQYKTICAFVQFPEKPMTLQMSAFGNLMNQLGYSANGTGSVRDFFKESSYNKFDLIITLTGVYTAPQSELYYAGSSGTANVPTLARWVAQKVAAEPSINFSDYDSDGDGYVDGFHFIFAGNGQESGAPYGTIWSHKSVFSPAVTQNGKSILVYSCSPELLEGEITTIGAICHEMTHAFGAPDFYDTDYEVGGQYFGTGLWDVMAQGSWNGTPSGSCPAHHNMYTKIQFGWVTPITLNAPTTITNMPNSAENPVAYIINTSTPNEYFLLENRQRIKFDADVPGEGLLIYRAKSNYSHNCTHPQDLYPICANAASAIPNSMLYSYGNINSAGCPFPGSDNKTAFTDVTTPSMQSWAGLITGKPITNITHNNGLIGFNFMMDGGTLSGTVTSASNPVAGVTVTLSPYNLVTTTAANGTYSFPHIPAGSYTLKTAKAGYQSYTANPTVTTGTTTTFNITLTTGNTFVIKASAGTNGTLSQTGYITVNSGSNQIFSITPNTDFVIDQVLIDNVNNPAAVAAGSYTFTNVTANHTIEVVFRISFCGGSGTATDPFLLCTPTQLDYVRYYLDKHFKLANDIDLTTYLSAGQPGYNNGAGWLPIGAATTALTFTGTFNGNGHKITGLWINRSETEVVGFFGCIVGGGIENLGIESAAAGINGKSGVGGMVGWSYLYASIKNCYFKGNVSGKIYMIGGLVGKNQYCDIESCYATGNVTCTGSALIGGIGGLIGSNTNACYGHYLIRNCYSTGNVSGPYHVGGLIGFTDFGIENCYATGNVSGNYVIGGLVGYSGLSDVFFPGCYIKNCVAANNSVTAVMICNRIVADGLPSVLTNNYANSAMLLNGMPATAGTHNNNDGASVETSTLKTLNFYSNANNWLNGSAWSIGTPTSIWNICEYVSMPLFKWQNVECPLTIVAIAGANGNINPSGEISVSYGSNKSFTFSPNEGYKVDQLLVDGVSVPDSVAGGSYTFKNITKNHFIQVTFKADAFCGGTGSAENPYLICDAQSLAFLATALDEGNGVFFAGKYFKLTNDIDLWDYSNWLPIGRYISETDFSKTFQGNFDGNHHVITNLKINRSSEDCIGLFGYIREATIQNLGIQSGNSHGYVFVGSLVGKSASNSLIANCYSKIYVSGESFTGGLAGYNEYSSILNCYTTGITNGGQVTGGLLGGSEGLSASVINCYASGNVTALAPYTGSAVGGLVGSNSGIIHNCVAANSLITSANASITNINRIVGLGGYSTYFKNNYAFKDMVIQAGTQIIVREDDATVNGTGKDFATLTSQTFYATAGNWYNSAWDIIGANALWTTCPDGSLPYFNWQEFLPCPRTIEASSDPNGNITPSGTVIVSPGESKTFTFSPKTGYIVNQLLVDGNDVPNAILSGEYTFVNVVKNHTIEVITHIIPDLSGKVTILGNAIFGETLTVNTNALTSDPVINNLGTLKYQWKRGSIDIGVNSANYTLVKADIGSTITVTVTASRCNGSVISDATPIISKATQTPPDAPKLAKATTNSITLYPITGCEYSIHGETWQSSHIFNDLTPATNYNFVARKAETDTHLASLESPAAQFATQPLSISENKEKKITIDPNPTTGELHVTSDVLHVTNAEVFDVYGRKLMSDIRYSMSDIRYSTSEIGKSEIAINIAHLQAGIYFVKIRTEAGEVVKKVVKR